MAHHFVTQGDFDSANKFYQLALMLVQTHYPGNNVELLDVYLDICRMCVLASRSEEARKYLDLVVKSVPRVERIEPGRKIKLLRLISSAYMDLGMVREAVERIKEAEEEALDTNNYE